jgi:hypothetical protein
MKLFLQLYLISAGFRLFSKVMFLSGISRQEPQSNFTLCLDLILVTGFAIWAWSLMP